MGAPCVICKSRPRGRTPKGTPMSICGSPECAEIALKRLDAAGVLPDELAERIGLRRTK